MRAKNSWVMLGLFGFASSLASGAELQLRVGESQILPASNVQGAGLDNPRIAEIQILNDMRVQVTAKGDGEGTLAVYSSDGKLLTYPIRVVGGKNARAAEGSSSKSAWPAAVFGGKRIPDARCTEPLVDEDAAAELNDARDLLRQEQFEEAIQKLDRALTIEPDAAVVYLFLGSAWARLKDQARGASSYETFALSCPDDPNARAVVRLLREFDRRAPRTKPES
jgi:tetratricopeptide (TPR) repeat protein